MDQPIVEILSRLGCLNLARKHIRLDINSFSIGREMLDAKVTCSSSRALRVQSIKYVVYVATRRPGVKEGASISAVAANLKKRHCSRAPSPIP
jgi:hypothetical protein